MGTGLSLSLSHSRPMARRMTLSLSKTNENIRSLCEDAGGFRIPHSTVTR